MKNFKEIAEKCLNEELSGNFIIHHQSFAKDDVEILKVPSKNLIIDSLLPAFPYLFKGNGVKGITCPYIANFNGHGVNRLRNYQIVDFIPDMKENDKSDKRTIQITLYQAREWYNSGNDTLCTLALSSFSKEELDPYPRSHSEYLKNHPGNIVHAVAPGNLGNKLTIYGALLSLREEWIHIWSQEQGLEKDWKPKYNKFELCIYRDSTDNISVGCFVNVPLSFPTRELATNFMNTFKSLLEQAKGLY